MTTAYLLDSVPIRQVDNNGAPVAGALLHTWSAGTTTNLVTFTDSTATTRLPNPVVADAGGFFPQIWLYDVGYDLEARMPNDTTVLWQSLNIQPVVPAGSTAGASFTEEPVIVATDGQTVVNLMTTFFVPGSGGLAVAVDGFPLPSSDITEISATSFSLHKALSTPQEISVRCGRMVNAGVDGAAVGIQLSGTGTAARSAKDVAADARSINSYAGADPTGATSSSVAQDSYRNYVEVQSFPLVVAGREPMRYDAGVYEIPAQTFSHRQAIQGRGRKSTFLKLKPGDTGSLFTFSAEDITSTSIDDTSHSSIRDCTLIGNRVDSVTHGTSRAINCPDAPFAIGAQYAPSIEIDDVEIYNFTDDDVYLGGNRNWALITRLISRYGNGDGIKSYGYDHRISSTDVGLHPLGTGINLQGGGGHVINANIYGNLYNVQVTAFVNATVAWLACFNDIAINNGMLIAAGAACQQIAFGRFYGNSKAGDNLYSDIRTAGEIALFGTDFIYDGGGVKPKLLLETNGTNPKVGWAPGSIDDSGGASSPYRTGITDFSPILRLAGLQAAYLGTAGPGALSAYIAGVEKVRIDAAGLSNLNAAQLIQSLATLTNYAAAAAGTLTNAPTAGPPTKWIGINDNGTIRKIPTWT